MLFSKIKENILIILFFFMIDCTLIVASNYILGNDYEKVPMGLEKTYKVLEADNNTKKYKESFDFLYAYNDIVVIAESFDKKTLGLYDPQMKYYLNSSKFDNSKQYRYFSYEDYKSSKRVAIVVDDIMKMVNERKVIPDYSTIKKSFNTEIINIFDKRSYIASQGAEIIFNLFSIDYGDIEKIYIDSDNKQVTNKVCNRLEKLGYKDQTSKYNSIFISLINSLHARRYVKIIFNSFILSLILLFLTFLSYLKKYKKFIYISKICGASNIEIILKICCKIYSWVFTCIILSSFLSSFYLNLIGENVIKIFNIFEIQILILLIIILSIFTSFYIFNNSNKLGSLLWLQIK